MSKAIYDCVDKYVVTATCRGPLHVGSSSGDNFDILIHPVTDEPFIQASGISGVLRAYCMKITDENTVKGLFGSKEDVNESKLKITDGFFVSGTREECGESEKAKKSERDVSIELRPHVKINPETGTVSDAKVVGGDKEKSGQKFEMQYVAAGSKFSFEIYLYGGSDLERNLVDTVLAALDAGEIQIGGKKSNGCGYLKNVDVMYRHYDMTDKNDRNDWIGESGLEQKDLPRLQSQDFINAYEITISASTEGELLVKAIAPEDPRKEIASNIRNANGEFIIPASSVKGAIRNRMQMIADYMDLNPAIIFDAFGKQTETDENRNIIEGQIGNLIFEDVVVGDGDNTNLHTRIRIDKFTGGVQNQALFKELYIFGDIVIRIRVANRNNPEAVMGLLMLAIRDLKYKLFALGSEQSVGNGYLDINEIVITDLKNEKTCSFDKDFSITDETDILGKCMNELRSMTVTQEKDYGT